MTEPAFCFTSVRLNFGNEGDYGRDAFNRQRFTEMAEHLKTVKGRFIISLNDCKSVREVFKDFQFATVGPTL
ncbi:hypothetical protein HGO34_25870 [Agrobacterium vitis]|uniref:DNA adenine methylase n=1 Tax=Agrobacterium vitis TaxID=373 RepID=A0AAE5AZ17_AGRVI|nr:hypothetical protein [Agrobacterium vitis]MCF1497082.1 hypothetical protein [Allorhizobium sp. Av2]MCM2443133.1 hypothetical protein [Agrobacterium vitis]MUZ60742.1 hypothetical protein [Agrobacterium vitis]MVA68925.1 hypothetical protein [Agrobacterium vitis]MVA90049.1 hypothetical protein [Agrobacterium vitis]